MASATIIVTRRNIASREETLRKMLSFCRSLPERDPRKAAARKNIGRIRTEIAALKASLYYYKANRDLSALISRQQSKVHTVRQRLAASKRGAGRTSLAASLKSELKKLSHMLAAAKAKSLPTPPPQAPLPESKPDLALIPASPETSVSNEAAPAPEVQPALSSGNSDLDALLKDLESSDMAAGTEFQPSEEALASLPSDNPEELDVLEEEEPFYKKPVFIVGAAVAAVLLLRR